MCVLIFFTTFVRNIFHSKNNSARHYHVRTRPSCAVRYPSPILIKLEFIDRFSKNPQISNFMKILPVAAEFFFHAGGQKNRQT